MGLGYLSSVFGYSLSHSKPQQGAKCVWAQHMHVCTLMTEMVSGIELQSLVSSVFLPDVAKESVSSLPL